MAEPLVRALSRVRGLLLDDQALLRAVASGRRKGETPQWRRVELRYVDLKAGRRLQVTAYDDDPGAHVEPRTRRGRDDGRRRPARPAVRQLARRDADRDTPAAGDQEARGDGAHHGPGHRPAGARGRRARPGQAPAAPGGRAGARRARDLRPARAGSSRAGSRSTDRSTSSCAASLRWSTTRSATGRLRDPTADDPLRIVDLGCGNAYLTFAAHALPRRRARAAGAPRGRRPRGPARRPQQRARCAARHRRAGVSFVPGDIATADAPVPPDVVLALHACDTATDDALARAVTWRAPVVLAAPCCHHDIAAQLRRSPTPAPYSLLTRNGILRERFADTLTDAVRAVGAAAARLPGRRHRLRRLQAHASQHAAARRTHGRRALAGRAPRARRADRDVAESIRG